jgi:hypothetical protein
VSRHVDIDVIAPANQLSQIKWRSDWSTCKNKCHGRPWLAHSDFNCDHASESGIPSQKSRAMAVIGTDTVCKSDFSTEEKLRKILMES